MKIDSTLPASLEVLSAAAVQLDIAAEDSEQAIDGIVASFYDTIDLLEEMATSVEASDKVNSRELLTVIDSIRDKLAKPVEDLQFQDRLVQRLALVSRELQLLAEADDAQKHVLLSQGAIPRSTRSLYSRHQLARIHSAAGHNFAYLETEQSENVDIELF